MIILDEYGNPYPDQPEPEKPNFIDGYFVPFITNGETFDFDKMIEDMKALPDYSQSRFFYSIGGEMIPDFMLPACYLDAPITITIKKENHGG